MAKIIVIGGTKGGPGKSTIAQQIAGALVLKKKQKSHLTDHRWANDDRRLG